MLNRDFYERDTATVARELLGMTLIHKTPKGTTSGRIVETEAYYGKGDPASRASKKKTKLNEIMWNRGGLSFLYMIHAHWMFNVTTEGEGTPGAVLIRALEPLEGIELMKKRRGFNKIQALTSGPGKLTQALRITKDQHRLDLTKPNKLSILEGGSSDFKVETSHRIGVTEDLERELRFYIAENKFVSK